MVLAMTLWLRKEEKKVAISSGQLDLIYGTRSTLMMFYCFQFFIHSFNSSVKFYFTLVLLIMNLQLGCVPGVMRFWDLGWTYINLLGGVN